MAMRPAAEEWSEGKPLSALWAISGCRCGFCTNGRGSVCSLAVIRMNTSVSPRPTTAEAAAVRKADPRSRTSP